MFCEYTCVLYDHELVLPLYYLIHTCMFCLFHIQKYIDEAIAAVGEDQHAKDKIVRWQ